MQPDSPIVIALDQSITSIESVCEGLSELWRCHPGVGSLDRMALETALIELATNVVRSAPDDGPRQVEVQLAVTPREVRAEVTDQGPEFRGHLDHFALPGAYAESGRGMAVIDALMDVFEYDRIPAPNRWIPAHNRWTITRRLTVPLATERLP